MSSLAAFANLDVDKLIQDIASRPAIWDKNFNGRQNKGFLEDTWDELVSVSLEVAPNPGLFFPRSLQAAIHNAPSKCYAEHFHLLFVVRASSLKWWRQQESGIYLREKIIVDSILLRILFTFIHETALRISEKNYSPSCPS